jgi:hypothetical protein
VASLPEFSEGTYVLRVKSAAEGPGVLSKISTLLKGSLVFGLGMGALALMPPAYIEIGCRASHESQASPRFIQEEWARSEKDAALSLPRHHMAFTYGDMAQTLNDGAVHDLGFMEGIKGYWIGLCAVMPIADSVGHTSKRERMFLYGTGIAFSFDLAIKALYEETIGRAVDAISRERTTPAERIEKDAYASLSEHLHDHPWWEFDWSKYRDALIEEERSDVLRDHERLGALWIEWSAKEAVADLLTIPAQTPPKRIAVHVSWVTKSKLSEVPNLRIEEASGHGYVVSFPRGVELTTGVRELVEQGGLISEISGADDFLLTVLSDAKPVPSEGAEVIAHIKRPGFEKDRFVVRARVRSLPKLVKSLDAGGDVIERILDH